MTVDLSKIQVNRIQVDTLSSAVLEDSSVVEKLATKQDTLVSGTNIKTVNNNSLLGSGNVEVSVEIDNNTITKNASDQLQTNGILNKKNASALNVWQGTYSDWVNGGTAIPYYNWQSTSGASWSYKNNTTGRYQNMAYGNGMYVLGDNYYCYASSDLETFTDLGMGVDYLYFGGDKFFALRGSTIKTSTDGLNWTTTSSGISNFWPHSMVYANNMYIIVGELNPGTHDTYAYSTDAVTWSIGTLPEAHKLTGITYGNGKFVAVGYDSTFLYSTDGISWSTGTLPQENSTAKYIAYGNGKFVIISYDNLCLYSTDGLNWTIQAITSSTYTYQIIFANGLFVISGDRGITYSSSGTSWNLITNGSWNRTAFNGSEYVTIGYASGYKFGLSKLVKNVYTLTTTPTTSTTLYSIPGTESSLTITSVSDDSLVLSDTYTYNRNSGGDLSVTGTVGQSYPNYLCFVDNKNVIKGNTVIAQMAPTKISDLEDDTATTPIDKADTLTDLTATITELNYTDGVTSNIQTQLNGKQPYLSSENAGTNITITRTGHSLPSEYQEVDYISIPSGAYVDLNVIPSNHQIEIKVEDSSYVNDKHWFGNSQSAGYLHFTTYNNMYYWGYNGSEGNGGSWTSGEHTLVFNAIDNNKIILDGTVLAQGTASSAPSNLLLFSRSNSANFTGKFFYCKVTDRSSEELVRELYPCYRVSDNVVGLYDKTNNVFYDNDGSGTFTLGEDVNDVAIISVSDLRTTVADTTSTTATIATVAPSTDYTFSQALTSLSVTAVTSSMYESTIYFTAGTGITVSLPSDIKILGSTPTYTAGNSYVICFKNGFCVVGVYEA